MKPPLYRKSNDPNLPCGLCVGWVDVDLDDPMMSGFYPIRANGERIDVLYDGTHPECDEMVQDYCEDHKDDIA